PSPLINRVWSAVVRLDYTQGQFLPIGQLLSLFSREAVEEELTIYRDQRETAHENEMLYRAIETEPSNESVAPDVHFHTMRGYRKIFAVLVLIQLPGRIQRFVNEGVSDADLPFVKVKTNELGLRRTWSFKLRRKNSRGTTLRCFQRWTIRELEMFESRQWLFLAPYFSRDPTEPRKVLQYILPESAVLPFTSHSRVSGTRTHCSQLFKVGIHPDHHSLKYDGDLETDCSHFFAIKELSPNAHANAQDELLALRLVNKTAHPHLITLLASYQQHENLYLIFPWAQCDLDSFWKQNDPQNDPMMRYWAMRQLEGLASGLAAIHSFRVSSEDSIFSGSPIIGFRDNNSPPAVNDQPEIEVELFCRHGDIKPQNILWFPDTNHKGGILKLADFGTAEVKAEEAASRQSYAWSQTYRPPESCDYYDYSLPRQALVATSYDIWGLGCVFLEFIVWLFGGPDALVHFTTERYLEDQSMDAHFQVGTAFFVLRPDGITGKPLAYVKKSVDQVCWTANDLYMGGKHRIGLTFIHST
ncbi:kinase-like domain-containing protein, partial [Apiosordaria backusii]